MLLVLRSLLLVVKCYKDMGIILTSSIIARSTPTIIPTKHPTSPNFLSNSRNYPCFKSCTYELQNLGDLEIFLSEVKNGTDPAGSIRKDSSQQDMYIKFLSVAELCYGNS